MAGYFTFCYNRGYAEEMGALCANT